MAAVEIINVTKRFGDTLVLKAVNLRIEKGKIVGIVGRNGSGKTVLLKLISGLLLPTEGSIHVFGTQIGKHCDFAPETGMVIEAPEFIPYQSAKQNLWALASIRRKIGKDEIQRVLALVGLDAEEKKSVGKYSLGMRQRLGLAQAIMEDPELLLMDEPMNGLDSAGVEEMRQLFLTLRAHGKTIVLASHIAADIELLCDEVYQITDGFLTPRDSEVSAASVCEAAVDSQPRSGADK